MDDRQAKLEQEVNELKAEVRRLRRAAEAAVVIIALAVVYVFPQLALGVLGVAIASLAALLVSPVRHLVFPSIFKDRSIANRKSQI